MKARNVNKIRPTRGAKEFWVSMEFYADGGMLLAETGRMVTPTMSGRNFEPPRTILCANYFGWRPNQRPHAVA